MAILSKYRCARRSHYLLTQGGYSNVLLYIQILSSSFRNFHTVIKGPLAKFKKDCRSACLGAFPQVPKVYGCDIMCPLQ